MLVFGLIKFVLLLGLLGFGFFCYDFFIHLPSDEKIVIKEEAKDVLDTGRIDTFVVYLGKKMRIDFDSRFWPKIKKAISIINEKN